MAEVIQPVANTGLTMLYEPPGEPRMEYICCLSFKSKGDYTLRLSALYLFMDYKVILTRPGQQEHTLE